jgi:hypothetical protein
MMLIDEFTVSDFPEVVPDIQRMELLIPEHGIADAHAHTDGQIRLFM